MTKRIKGEVLTKIDNLLKNVSSPLGETNMDLSPNAIYDIPPEWEDNSAGALYKLIVDPFGDISSAVEFNLKAKINVEETTTDKKGKKKDDKKEEISEEDLQRYRDANAQDEAIWDTLSTSQQRYKRAENITKCARLDKTTNLSASITGEDVVLLEDLVFEGRPLEVYVFRYTVAADKKAKKGEEKMEVGIAVLRGQLTLEPLKAPGAVSTSVKLDLQPLQVEEADKDTFIPLFKSSLHLDESVAAEWTFKKPELTNTPYVALDLKLSNPVVPANISALKISDIIPKRTVAKVAKTGNECLVNFNLTLQNYMNIISKEYFESFKEDIQKENNSNLSELDVQKIRDYRRERFLSEFVDEGKYDRLKDKLKKHVSEIVREKFKKASLDKLKGDERDMFLSELYSFLTDQVKTSIRLMVENRRDTLNIELVEGYEQAQDKLHSQIRNLEPEQDDGRIDRLIKEYSLSGEYNVCEYYYKARMQAAGSMDAALDLAIFKVQRHQLDDAEDMLYNIVQDDLSLRPVYGLILWEKGEYGPANALFSSLVLENNFDIYINLILHVLYAKNGNEQLSKKYYAIAKRLKLQELGKIKSIEQKLETESELNSRNVKPTELANQHSEPDAHLYEGVKRIEKVNLTDEEHDSVIYSLIDYVSKFKLRNVINELMLLLCQTNTQKYYEYKIESCSISEDSTELEELVEGLQAIGIKISPMLLIKIGDIFYTNYNHVKAEQYYTKAMREGVELPDYSFLLKLGNIYLNKQQWDEARKIFLRSCTKLRYSIGFLGLATACYEMDLLKEAEDALCEANILNIENKNVWLLLTLLNLKNEKVIMSNQTFRELFKPKNYEQRLFSHYLIALYQAYEKVELLIPEWKQKAIKALKLVREDDQEYQDAQTFLKKLGYVEEQDQPKKHEKKDSKPMLDYVGGYPAWTDSHKCLVRKHMTKDMYDRLKDKTTSNGFTLDYAIRAGVMLPHVGVGIVNDGVESLNLYKELYDKIVEGWHGFTSEQMHTSNMNPADLKPFTIPQETINKYVKSTRTRAGRSINGLSLPAFTGEGDRAKVEELLKQAFATFEGDLAGQYYSLGSMPDAMQQELRGNGNLFQEPTGPALLAAAGAGRDWPNNRGIFCADSRKFFVWVNEEDHMRIISMEEGGDIVGIFERWSRGVETMRKVLEKLGSGFQFDDHFGYIHTCPSNLGTGLRASAMILLPQLSEALTPHQLEDFAKRFGVQARGGSGEHTPAGPGGKWDISNYQRIGFTEVELVQKMINGVEALISVEQRLEQGTPILEAMGEHKDILN